MFGCDFYFYFSKNRYTQSVLYASNMIELNRFMTREMTEEGDPSSSDVTLMITYFMMI